MPSLRSIGSKGPGAVIMADKTPPLVFDEPTEVPSLTQAAAHVLLKLIRKAEVSENAKGDEAA